MQIILNSSSLSRTSGPEIHSDQKFSRFLLIAILSGFRGRDPRWAVVGLWRNLRGSFHSVELRNSRDGVPVRGAVMTRALDSCKVDAGSSRR